MPTHSHPPTALTRARFDLLRKRLPRLALGWLAVTLGWTVLGGLEDRTLAPVGLLAFQAAVVALGLSVCRRARTLRRLDGYALGLLIVVALSWTVFAAAQHGRAIVVNILIASLCATSGAVLALGWRRELVLVLATFGPTWLADPWLVQAIPPLQSVGVLTLAGLVCVIIAEGSLRALRATVLHRAAEDEARRQLAASRDAYRDLAEKAREHIWTCDLEGRLTYVNAAAASAHGVAPSELIGRSYASLVTDNDCNPRLDDVVAALAGGDDLPPLLVEVEPHGGTAHRQWREIVVGGMHDAEGRLTGIRGTSRDVTERVLAEERLRASEAKFRNVTESMSVIVFIYQDARFRYVNETACAVSGYAREELLAMDLATLMPSPNRDAAEALAHAMEEGLDRWTSVERRVLRKDGSAVYVAWSGVVIDYEGAPAILGTGIDVTEQQEARRALARSEERYRGLVEAQHELVVRVTPDGILTFANDAYCIMFGRPREELEGKAWAPRCHPDDLERTLDVLATVAHPPHRATFQNRALAIDGVRWIEWEAGAILVDGVVAEIQGAGRDVTARHEAQEALHQTLDALRASEDKLRRLANRQALIREEERKRVGFDLHDDVCQELVGVAIMIESARRRMGAGAPGYEELARGLGYVNEVVEHLRKLAGELRPMQLHDLGLTGSLRALADGMSSPTTMVTTDLPKRAPRLDEETELAVYRIAQEAVANAIRHGAPLHVSLSLAATADSLDLEVRDDGCGFDPKAARIAAVGLVSMEERALALGGVLEVDSAPGSGATVRLHCPRRRREPSSAA